MPAPDPATTTAPVSAVTDTTGAPDGWDFLDDPDAGMPTDDSSTETFPEDVLKDKEPVPAKDDSKKESGEVPEKESEPEKKSEPEPGVEDLKAKATTYESLDEALRTDPSAVVKAIIEGMGAHDRTELLKEIGSPSYSKFDVEKYDPQGEMEVALKERWKDIEAVSQLAEQTSALESRMQDQHGTLIPHISEANVVAQLALTKVAALCDALGIELPDPEPQVLQKALDSGRVSYKDAVKKSVDYSKQVTDHKQRRTHRPVTPGNASRKPEPIPEGTGMVEIAKRLGTLR